MCQKTPIEDHRETLHDILVGIEGIKAVYYQPPSTKALQYPCIIYSLNRLNTKPANNNRYLNFPEYNVVLIDYDPESMLQRKILDLNDGCYVKFDRFYTSDNLNHWAYTLSFAKKMW